MSFVCVRLVRVVSLHVCAVWLSDSVPREVAWELLSPLIFKTVQTPRSALSRERESIRSRCIGWTLISESMRIRPCSGVIKSAVQITEWSFLKDGAHYSHHSFVMGVTGGFFFSIHFSHSVIIRSLSCCSEPEWLSLFCETQKDLLGDWQPQCIKMQWQWMVTKALRSLAFLNSFCFCMYTV